MNRLAAAWRARGLERRIRAAQRREDAALRLVGRALFAARPLDEKHGFGARLVALEHRETMLAAWRQRVATSLEGDRADYAIATPALRWLVVVRGILDRMILRNRLRHGERELEVEYASLGREALASNDPKLNASMPGADVTDVVRARSDHLEQRRALEELLRPWNGVALPGLLRELVSFGRFVRRQLISKLPLTAPALAGLFAGWWVASTFTDSWREGWLADTLGLGSKRSVSPETMERLRFWMPLIAAALCAYLGAFLTSRVHKRYMHARPPKA